jgi:hypothetical protein
MAWLFSAERLLQKLILHARLSEHLLQVPVPFLDGLHLSDHRGVHASELRAPTVKRCGADAVLPAKVRDRNPALGLAQNRDDLCLGKSTPLHSNLLVDVTEKILLPNPLQKRGGITPAQPRKRTRASRRTQPSEYKAQPKVTNGTSTLKSLQPNPLLN